MEKEKSERKRGGFLWQLFVRLGMGSGGAASQGAGGLAFLGSKAVLAMLVAGSLVTAVTVGGLKILGGNGDSGGVVGAPGDEFNSIFARRAPENAAADGAAAGPGESASLQYLVDANQKPDAVPKGGEAKPDTPAQTASQAVGGSGPLPNGAATAAGGALNSTPNKSLSGVKKFGELSKSVGGPGPSGSSSSVGSAATKESLSAGTRLASSSAMSQNSRRRLSLSGQRGIAGFKKKGAGRELLGLDKKMVGAQNFRGGGGSIIDGGASEITTGEEGPEGSSQGKAGVKDKTPAGGAQSVNPEGLIDVPGLSAGQTREVTPWKKTIEQVALLTMGAGLLLMASSVLLGLYHETWVKAYNDEWNTVYNRVYAARALACESKLGACVAAAGGKAMVAGFTECIVPCPELLLGAPACFSECGLAAGDFAAGVPVVADKTVKAAKGIITAGQAKLLIIEAKAKAELAEQKAKDSLAAAKAKDVSSATKVDITPDAQLQGMDVSGAHELAAGGIDPPKPPERQEF